SNLVQVNYTSTSSPLYLRRSGSAVIMNNGLTEITLSGAYGTRRWKPYFYISIGESGFQDVVTSFNCALQKPQFAKLKYDLDGYYHIMEDGFIRFVYDQEYGSSELKFNIYNGRDELMKTQTNYS